MEEKVLDMVRSRGLSDRVVFSSFNHESVNKIKNLAPEIPCGYICWGKLDGEALVESMKKTGVEFIHPGLESIDAKFMDVVKKNGLLISVWTVNDIDEMNRMIKFGVYGVFTDDPKLHNDTFTVACCTERFRGRLPL